MDIRCPTCGGRFEAPESKQGETEPCALCGADAPVPIVLQPVSVAMAGAAAPPPPLPLPGALQAGGGSKRWALISVGLIALAIVVWAVWPGGAPPGQKAPEPRPSDRSGQQGGLPKTVAPTPARSRERERETQGQVKTPVVTPVDPRQDSPGGRSRAKRTPAQTAVATPGAPTQGGRARPSQPRQAPTGAWQRKGDILAQTSLIQNATCTFGDDGWSDYEFSLEARKDSGAEGFLVLFRSRGPVSYYWFNFGGWNNTQHALERGAGASRTGVGPRQPGKIETGRWYAIRVRCEGERIQVWLDGQPVCDQRDSGRAAELGGRVGVGTWSTAASFRNFKVTSLQGAILYSGVPAVGTE